MSNTRLTIRKKDENDVLLRSRRICGFCFGLQKDFNIKRGQIAHLDQNNQNRAFENLMFMCIPHHDEYDSTTSQSKNLTIGEAKEYRDRVYNLVAGEAHNDTLHSVQRFIQAHFNVKSEIGSTKQHLAVEHSLGFTDALYSMASDALGLSATCFNKGESTILEILGTKLNLLYETLSDEHYILMPTRRKFDNSEFKGNEQQGILRANMVKVAEYSEVIVTEFLKLQQFCFNKVHIDENGQSTIIPTNASGPGPLRVYSGNK